MKTKSVALSPVSWWTDFKLLVKFKLTMLVVVTSIMSYLIAAGVHFNWLTFGLVFLGGFFVTGAANALNQILERDFDKLMERTANRPVASNRMNISEALMWAGMMCLVGITCLALINPLTAFLGMLSLVLYAFIYTPLKRYTTLSVAIGAIPGAMPAMIGCVAFDGHLSALALILFSIQFLWQFPHFWAIGWLSFEQYQKAGFKLLPESNGAIDPSLGLHCFIYSLLLLPISYAAFSYGYVGVFQAIMLSLVSLTYATMAYKFYKNFDRKSALGLMFSSFFYLPVALGIFMISLYSNF